jgi:hypothetical protein
LSGAGIKVNALAPGLRRTDLNATAAASGGDPAEAAAAAVRLALLPDRRPTGEFFSEGQVDGLGVVCCDCGVPGFRLLVSADQAENCCSGEGASG